MILRQSGALGAHNNAALGGGLLEGHSNGDIRGGHSELFAGDGNRGDTFDVTAAEDLSVVINRTKWAPGENNSLTEVEDTNSDTPAASASFRISAASATLSAEGK